MATIETTRHDGSISSNRRGTVIRRLIVLVALTVVLSSCSTVQVQLWWKVYLGQNLTYSQAEQTAEKINRNVTPGCDPDYRAETRGAPCLPNNVTDVDCEFHRVYGTGSPRFRDGPVFAWDYYRVTGFDHYQLRGPAPGTPGNRVCGGTRH